MLTIIFKRKKRQGANSKDKATIMGIIQSKLGAPYYRKSTAHDGPDVTALEATATLSRALESWTVVVNQEETVNIIAGVLVELDTLVVSSHGMAPLAVKRLIRGMWVEPDIMWATFRSFSKSMTPMSIGLVTDAVVDAYFVAKKARSSHQFARTRILDLVRQAYRDAQEPILPVPARLVQ